MTIPWWLFAAITVVLIIWAFWSRNHGRHTHLCSNCGHIWEHGAEARGDEAAHTCEKCGTEDWWVHEFV